MEAIVSWIAIAISILLITNNYCFARKIQEEFPEAKLRKHSAVNVLSTSNNVVMDNGITQVTFANPGGYVTSIRYNGIDNLLEVNNEPSNRGYFDVVWNTPGNCSSIKSGDCSDWMQAKKFRVVRKAADRSEISFYTKWNQSTWKTDSPKAPLNVDRRYVMFKDLPGFYSYTILEREANYPETNINQIRVVYKLDKDRFHYMAMSNDRQRFMPMPNDRATGEVLAYKEAVRLVDPVNPEMKGEVDDKYQYSIENHKNKLHGWIASNSNPTVGFWIITPSDEFRSAGPFKQSLTSHTGPTCLQMLHSYHYAGEGMSIEFKQGEPWKKVFGPFLIYLNSNKENAALWQDAKRQLMQEIRSWPYVFPLSADYVKPKQRGSLSGQLFVKDRFGANLVTPAANAWVGLAAVGETGSWQVETKGYQFWVQTDEEGIFFIKGILNGTYNLYATVAGFIGDYKYESEVLITIGRHVSLGDLTYEPLRNGPTLWEIGVPDRSAAEFFVPNPESDLVNKLFLNKTRHTFRQYGLWDKYSQQYANGDLVYTIGRSDYSKDWFFAHVVRKEGQVLKPTTWRIVFPIAKPQANATYTLRIAIAAASAAEIQVRINDPARETPHFTTKLIGKDNAIARHGIHGLYRLFNVDVFSSLLRPGANTIYLTQTRYKSIFTGVMYDYIRLEGPYRNT